MRPHVRAGVATADAVFRCALSCRGLNQLACGRLDEVLPEPGGEQWRTRHLQVQPLQAGGAAGKHVAQSAFQS